MVAPVITTFLKLTPVKLAPCRLVCVKSTPGPIMYPPDEVVTMYLYVVASGIEGSVVV